MSVLDIKAIEEILPHRYPFLLVDRVIELGEEHIVAIKNVTMNEPFFTGHFPGNPVMPGVLIIEAMAQTAGVLVLKKLGKNEHRLVFLATIDAAKFRKPVVPGDQLRLEVTFVKMKPTVIKVQCKGLVDGEVAAEAELMCRLVDNATAPEKA